MERLSATLFGENPCDRTFGIRIDRSTRGAALAVEHDARAVL